MCFSVGRTSKLLRSVAYPQDQITSWIKQVRVILISRGQGHLARTHCLYVGIIQDLVFDPWHYH